MEKCWCGNAMLKEYSSDYYRCDRCHTLVSKREFNEEICDVKNEEEDLYGRNYWEIMMTRAAGKSSLSDVVDMYLTERVIYWLRYILKYVKLGASVAEVGCGLGQLQYVLRRLGYCQKAFELSPDICEYMEKQLNITAHCGPFVSQKDAYDSIMAFDLFEHLVEPEEFIQNCASSLRSNGILCLQTPCYDPALDYKGMLEKKTRFKEQLKEEQHIYLYSRESISNILNKYGFSYVIFEPAFFGDDYDMFLFASKSPISVNTEEEIDEYLNSVENGRLIKAMNTLFDRSRKLEKDYQVADSDRTIRLEQIKKLEALLKESEEDREARKIQIDKLTEELKRSEANRAAMQGQNDKLTQMLAESDADRAARLGQINELTVLLKKNEADSVSMQGQIDKLTQMLTENNADRAARLGQINELTVLLKKNEEDRTSMQGQIDKLTQMLAESDADRAARLRQINELTALLEESEADRAARLVQIEELTTMVKDSARNKQAE